ncbi:antibiotic biosynthesis monooxygenase family protein [Pacificispira sp.]|uniref:antibiotic biosynthesis monooxygenase family protein n=1 Tax=Pacificispira sp. TaxID=2888761 RepID=UPI003BAD9008
MLAPLYDPPYFAVIFTAIRTGLDEAEYARTAAMMDEKAATMPGYLGVESTRDLATGLGITVSYWRDEASLLAWKRDVEHTAARDMGRARWYTAYATRIARVEREYDYRNPDHPAGE